VRPRKVAPKEDAGTQTPPPTTARPQPAPAQSAPPPQPAAPASKQPGDAQTAEEVGEDEVVRVDSNLVIIPASVVDGRGRAITDLKVEDFELKIDGQVKPIGELTRAETPVHVALLFDNSASLSAAREFEKQAAVRFFKSVVRPIDRAAVYSISTVPTLAQGLTNDVPRLVRTIERFGAPDGATALFDAVAQAADYMRPLTGRKVLVLVSDGTDTVSDVNFDEAVNRALRAECQIYVVQTRQVEDPNLHDPVSEQRMYRISEQTGGAVFIPQTVEELDAVFTQISLDISQQYLLSYYPQDERKDKYFRFISLSVKSRPSLRVRARKGFYPEAAQAPQGSKGDATQFSGAPARSAATPAASDASASYRRAAAETQAPVPARGAAPAGRARPGPDGPDLEEAAARKQATDEPTPTFTLTTSAPAVTTKASDVTPKASNTSSLFSNAPERAGTTSIPVETSTATNSATRPSPEPAAVSAAPPKPETAPTPAAAVEESRAAKATDAKDNSKAPISGGVLNGKALSLPKPTYPAAARNSGASGKVVVEVTIDERGKIIEARAVSGHPFLQQAAVQAARMARFEPARLSGAPVKIKGTINYVFTLP
jgi:Ca-activated chloride channel family protein